MWVPAGDGYELSLDGAELSCRDDQGQVCEPIPRRVLETSAYPAWALIHDPGNAEAGLEVVAGLERAARSKSSDAASTYVWLARSLPAPHLPVFWEHAGRALIRAGDAKRAAVAFGRAREAEDTHALHVDETVWSASHLEFAAAGALSAKSTDAFAAGLRDRLEPVRALEALTELAVVRTRSGSPPWPGLARQVTALARAAGRDAIAEQQRLIERLLPLPAIRQTPFALWKAWRPALVPPAKATPGVRALLLDLFPVADDIDGWWLDLLDECAALAALTGDDPSGPEPLDGAAGWLTRAVLHPQRVRRDRTRRPLPRQLAALIPRMSARLAADATPVRLGESDRWDGPHGWDRFLRVIDVRVLEACLAHDVPVAPPAEDTSLGLDYWMSDRDPGEDIPALAADPDFAPLLHKAMDRYRDRGDLERVPALRPLLQAAVGGRPTGSEAIPRHPLDDAKVARALYGLSERWVSSNDSGMLRGIQLAGRLLDGSLAPDALEPDGFRAMNSYLWLPFIGRIGAVALRAVAASTRVERRERLLALLEVWAETPFADTGARLRTGIAETERSAVRGEHGTAVAVGWAGEGRRRFIDVRDGAGEPPSLGPVTDVNDVLKGWGGADRLRRLVSLVRDRGPVPWDQEAVGLLARRTGLSRPAAALTLAGVPGSGSYNPPFLDANERKILRLKAAEADDARAELGRLTVEQRLDLLASVLPDDPADLWEPGGLHAVAERVAETWTAQFGRRVGVPEATVAAAAALGSRLPAAEMCAALADPRAVPVLTTDVDSWLEKGKYGITITSLDLAAWRFEELLSTLTLGVCWAYAELPAGDPVRTGAPEAVELLRERLAHSGLLLKAGSPGFRHKTIEDLRARFGDEPYQGPQPLDVDSVDDGLTVGIMGSYSPDLFFRPALLGEDARTQALLTTASYGNWTLTDVRWLLGEACDRMMARIRSGALPEGAYEADPLAAVPDLVTEVAERFGLEPDPAALYLQLLTLLRPTDRNVRTWNGWKPPRHKAAVAALTGRGLVIEAKRARAGREVFLPGGWVNADKPHLPLESWKAKLYGLSVSADGKTGGLSRPWRPLPELYAAAWQRVLDGDQPG